MTIEELKTTKFILYYNKKKYEFYLNEIFFPKQSGDDLYTIITTIITKETHSFEYDVKNNKLFNDNKDLNNIYEDYLKNFLNSKITQEYFEYIDKYDEYNFIFNNNNIIKELYSNTIYVKFPCDNVSGITDKDLYFIFINKKYQFLSPLKRIIEINGKLISLAHEYINHCSRIILSCNNSDISRKTPENPYKFNIFNKKTKNHEDGGDKWELITLAKK